MLCIDEILSINSAGKFERMALALFRHQAQRCAPYAEYLSLMGITPGDVDSVEKIPFMPIEFFKTHDIYCGAGKPEIVFTSSATTGMTSSRHPMAHLEDYRRTFTAAFEMFYGHAEDVAIFALLPGYLEREGSSLVYMADRLIAAGSGGGGFFLNDYENLLEQMARCQRPKILLGVSYALWDLAERYAPDLSGTIVMETGGMKGRREELPRAEFHKILTDAFGVETIHSEYGMAELTSQGYSSGEGVFRCPPWMKVLARDLNDPFDIKRGAKVSGGVNIIDLANLSSCAFIQTQDLGTVWANGSFSVNGRVARSDIRGCNLLVQ